MADANNIPDGLQLRKTHQPRHGEETTRRRRGSGTDTAAGLNVDIDLDLNSCTNDGITKYLPTCPLQVRRIRGKNGRPVSAEVNYDTASNVLFINAFETGTLRRGGKGGLSTEEFKTEKVEWKPFEGMPSVGFSTQRSVVFGFAIWRFPGDWRSCVWWSDVGKTTFSRPTSWKSGVGRLTLWKSDVRKRLLCDCNPLVTD